MTEFDDYDRWRYSMASILSDIQSNLSQSISPTSSSTTISKYPIDLNLFPASLSSSAVFPCSNDDYETLREEINLAVQDAVQKLEQQIQITNSTFLKQMQEREQKLEHQLCDRLQELVHGYRSTEIQSQTELRSDLATLRRQIDLYRVRIDDQSKQISLQTTQCQDALALAKRLQIRLESEDADQIQDRDQIRSQLHRLESNFDQGQYRMKQMQDQLDNLNRMKDDVKNGLGQMEKSMESVKSEALLSETRCQRKFVEIGADLVEMHELVEYQVRETRSLLDTVQKSQQQLIEQCCTTSTQIADQRVQQAVLQLADRLDRLDRQVQEQNLDQDRVSDEIHTQLQCMSEILSNKSDIRLISNITEQIQDLQKHVQLVTDQQTSCQDRIEIERQSYRSIQDDLIQIKEQIQSNSDLMQSKIELQFHDVHDKYSRLYEHLRSDIQHDSIQISELKKSLLIWIDPLQYESTIESLCKRLLDRYQIEPGFRSHLVHEIACNSERLQSDLQAQIEQIHQQIEKWKRSMSTSTTDLTTKYDLISSKYRDVTETCRNQIDMQSSTLRTWCESMISTCRTGLEKLLDTELQTLQDQLHVLDTEHVQLRDKLTYNAEMVIQLGRNHLDEVSKRKEIMKDLLYIKSRLLEIQPLDPGSEFQRVIREAVRPQDGADDDDAGSDDERCIPDLGQDRDQFSVIDEEELDHEHRNSTSPGSDLDLLTDDDI